MSVHANIDLPLSFVMHVLGFFPSHPTRIMRKLSSNAKLVGINFAIKYAHTAGQISIKGAQIKALYICVQTLNAQNHRTMNPRFKTPITIQI